MTAHTSSRRNSQAKSRRKSKATIFTHRKFLWLEQIARDRGLPPLAAAVCILLSPYFNLSHDGAAWPYQDTLAASLGICRETVNRIIKALIERGHLEVTTTRGRHKASVYRLVLKGADTTKCDQTVTLSEAQNVPNQSGKCDQPITQTPLMTPVASKEATQEERETFAYANDESSHGGGPPADAGPRQETAKQEKQESSFTTAAPSPRPESPTERFSSVERAESFRELCAMWARPWPDDVAAGRRAFEAACEAVAPETILEAAKSWVAAADAPRFLPPLAKWLTNHGWEKPPPTKKAMNGGNGYRGNGYRKPNIADIGAELAARYAAQAAAERGES